MTFRSLFLLSTVVAISIFLSCAARQNEILRDPASEPAHPSATGEQSALESRSTGGENSVVVDDRARETLHKVLSDADTLRAESMLLAEEGDLEKAREKLDEALNNILGSGLALDAHSELDELFRGISTEAIAIDELLAQADSELQEATLADELEEVKSEEDLGETETAPPEVTYDLPVVINDRVRQFIERFQGERREAFAEGMVLSGRYLDMFKRILREEGLPADLAYMPQIESTYKVRAYSRASAKGIWQFMSWTAKRYGLKIDWWVDERSDPEKSCRAAARYLKALHKELGGDWLLAMAAYNGGPGRVGTAVRRLKTRDFWKISSTHRYLRRETRNFVPAILAAIIIMKQPQAYGFGGIKPDPPLRYDKVPIGSPTDLRVAAELAGVTVSELQELNPDLRRLITPANYAGFELKLPPGTKERFEVRFAALPPKKRLKYAEHVVRSGETLSGIARRYGTTIAAIQYANNIANPHRLSRGAHLIVPLSEIATPNGYRGYGYSTGTKLVHTVRRGESLYTIARAYGTTVYSIASWNRINPSGFIYPGNRLTVIAGTRVSGSVSAQAAGNRIVHSVRRGDTLFEIAMRYKTSVSQLKRWNNLRRNLIHPGDRLTIYLGGAQGNNN